MRLTLNTDSNPSLLVPTRMDVFSTITVVKGRKPRQVSVGWQAWNQDPAMETRMTRLRGSGSFYWPNALRAYLAARQLMRENMAVHQIKIETISGVEIARLYR